jgi:hypothetical protein
MLTLHSAHRFAPAPFDPMAFYLTPLGLGASLAARSGARPASRRSAAAPVSALGGGGGGRGFGGRGGGGGGGSGDEGAGRRPRVALSALSAAAGLLSASSAHAATKKVDPKALAKAKGKQAVQELTNFDFAARARCAAQQRARHGTGHARMANRRFPGARMRSPSRRAAPPAAPHAARTARPACAPRACCVSQPLALSGGCADVCVLPPPPSAEAVHLFGWSVRHHRLRIRYPRQGARRRRADGAGGDVRAAQGVSPSQEPCGRPARPLRLSEQRAAPRRTARVRISRTLRKAAASTQQRSGSVSDAER